MFFKKFREALQAQAEIQKTKDEFNDAIIFFQTDVGKALTERYGLTLKKVMAVLGHDNVMREIIDDRNMGSSPEDCAIGLHLKYVGKGGKE